MKTFVIGLVFVAFMLSLTYAYSSSYNKHETTYESEDKAYGQEGLGHEAAHTRFGNGFDEHIYGSYVGHNGPEHYNQKY